MVLVSFWRYPDPDQRFLKRIRIRPNETDPYRSGSITLGYVIELSCTAIEFVAEEHLIKHWQKREIPPILKLLKFTNNLSLSQPMLRKHSSFME